MNSKTILLTLFNIKKNEEKAVLLLLVYSFCVGIAYAFLYTTATSLFLANFKINILPYAYIGGGLLSYLLWIFYNKLENRQVFSRLLLFGSVFLLVSISLLAIGFYVAENKWLAFFLFVWINVFMFFTGVGFWGIASRIFDLRQGKRLFGLIGSGEILSKIISFFSVPFFLKFLVTKQLLFIIVLGLILSLIVLVMIIKKYNEFLAVRVIKKISEEETENKSKKKKGYFEILKNNYFFYIFILALFPLFAAYFVDFMFLNQTKLQFSNQELVSSFLGVFFGIMSVTEFILKSFVSGRLIDKYGILFSLVILPIVLLFSTVSASVYGTFYGATAMFFSFIVLSKLFVRVFRTSFLDPSFQILYQPIPSGERLAFQSKVEGVPKSVGNIFAGVILIVVASIKSLTIVHYNYLFLLVLIVWVWISYKLYLEYRISLKKTISVDENDEAIIHYDYKSNLFSFCEMAEAVNRRNFYLLYNLIQHVDPMHTNAFLLRLLLSAPDDIQKEILKKIVKKKIISGTKVLKSYLLSNPESRIIDAFQKALISLEESEKIDFEKIAALTHSGDREDRYMAACLLEYSGRFKTYKLLIELLQDEDSGVRKAALISSAKLKKSELWPYIIRNIGYEEYSNTAISAIKIIGEPILSDLENYFNKATVGSDIQLKIISVYSFIGGQKVINILRAKINYSNDYVRYHILLALSKMDYRATPKEIPYIKEYIEDEIALTVWIMASLADIQEVDNAGNLTEALQNELQHKKDNIFLLLSLIYDSKTIKFIIEAFENGTRESRVFALEMLDITVSHDIKDLVVPLLDEMSAEECMRKYGDRFPQQKLSVKERLIDILNKNYLKINRWTKVCALQLLDNYKDIESVLLANVLNPDPFLMETSISLLCKIKSERLTSIISRLKAEKKHRVENYVKRIQNQNGNYFTLLDKANLVKKTSFFSSVPQFVLTKLIETSEEIHMQKGESIKINRAIQDNIYFTIDGQVVVYTNKKEELTLRSNEIYWGIVNDTDDVIEFKAPSPAFLLALTPGLLYNALSNNSDYTKAIVRSLSEKTELIEI